MAKRFWCSRNDIISALKAEGFYWKDKFWNKYCPGYGGLYADVKHIQTFLSNCCPSREDLPRVLADSNRAEFAFGKVIWHHGIKSVLCRLL